MIITNQSCEILNVSHDNPLCFIEQVARTCYKSEDKITKDSSYRFVATLIERGHEAMLEHVSITVKFICDRGVSHELVRHRIASYAQESTRYCNYYKDKFNGQLTFIDPMFWSEENAMYKAWKLSCLIAENTYLEMIEHGATPQEARTVLPNSIKTEIITTANIREWRNILKLRTSYEAHPQIRKLMQVLLLELQAQFPILFDDIGGN